MTPNPNEASEVRKLLGDVVNMSLGNDGISSDQHSLILEAMAHMSKYAALLDRRATDEGETKPTWEWERRDNDGWFFTIPRVEYWVAFSIDENSGEVWHAYFDRFGPEHDGEMADKIGVYRTKGEAQAACAAHYAENRDE